jgi:hypothetical protein
LGKEIRYNSKQDCRVTFQTELFLRCLSINDHSFEKILTSLPLAFESSLDGNHLVDITGVNPGGVTISEFNESLTVLIQLSHDTIESICTVIVVSYYIVPNLWRNTNWNNVSLRSVATVTIMSEYLTLVASDFIAEGALEPSTTSNLFVPLHKMSIVDTESLNWWINDW